MRLPHLLIAVLTAFVPATQAPSAGEKESVRRRSRRSTHNSFTRSTAFGAKRGKRTWRPGPTGVKIDARNRALVDIRADPTPALQNSIRRMGGLVLSTSVRGRSIIARVPLLKLETLAVDPAVRFISPAAEAITGRSFH
jgi:hypothetical protein